MHKLSSYYRKRAFFIIGCQLTYIYFTAYLMVKKQKRLKIMKGVLTWPSTKKCQQI